MRTTVDISDDLIAALHTVAVKKGYRGYSKVVSEAVTRYLGEIEKKENQVNVLLHLRGCWTSEEATETRKKLEEIRKNWGPLS